MLKKINSGKQIIGMFLSEFPVPNIVRLMQSAGVDFVVVDCEHGFFDYSQVAAIAAVGNGIGFPVIVRISEISRACIQKYLDSGVDGIWAPMVETAEQAVALIEFGKYAPEGRRGISTMRPHSNYNPGKLLDYTLAANKRTMFFVQIETRKGAINADKILSTKGLTGVFIGPNDLACDLGCTGNLNTPEMDTTIELIISSAQTHKLPCGIVASNPQFLRKWRMRGMNMFSCDSELGLLKKGIQKMLSDVKDS